MSKYNVYAESLALLEACILNIFMQSKKNELYLCILHNTFIRKPEQVCHFNNPCLGFYLTQVSSGIRAIFTLYNFSNCSKPII